MRSTRHNDCFAPAFLQLKGAWANERDKSKALDLKKILANPILCEAFDEIINNMPESEAAFQIAKESLISRLRTERTVRDQVLWSYISLRDMGLTEDRDKQIFEKVQTMTLDDVKAAQEKWVKDRPYVYAILGDIKDLDLNYLKTLGPIKTLSQEEIFGY